MKTLNENKLICVDIKCQEKNKIVDSWESMMKHQNLYHQMLTLSQFYESMQKIRANQTSKDNINQINKFIQDYETQVGSIINKIERNIHSLITEHFNELNKKIIIKFREQVSQNQKNSQIQLDEFYVKIFQQPYQELTIQQFQGQNSNQWINDEARKYQQEIEQKVNHFYQKFQQFFLQQKDKEIENQNFHDINNISRNSQTSNQFYQQKETQIISLIDSIDHDSTPPLKNYRSIQQQPQNEENHNNHRWNQDYREDRKPREPRESRQNRNYQGNKEKLIIHSNEQFTTIPKKGNKYFVQETEEIKEYFKVPKFEYLQDDVTDFSYSHMYGPLEIDQESKCIETKGNGMILFEGFINKFMHQDFELWIEKKSKDFYVEIGVIDWNKFKFPKQNAPQKGVYSYNSRGEIFNDEELKMRNLMIQNESQIFVTYDCDSENLIYRFLNHNQAISLSKVKKNKLTFFAKISKALITICQ